MCSIVTALIKARDMITITICKRAELSAQALEADQQLWPAGALVTS